MKYSKTKSVNYTRVLVYISIVLLPGLRVCAQELEKPKLFQVTTAETLPGNAVLVRGEFLDKVSAAKISRLEDESQEKGLPGYVSQPHPDRCTEKTRTDRVVNGIAGPVQITVKLLQHNRQSLKLLVPPAWKAGVYSVSLLTGGGRAGTFYLNMPVVNWVVSEAGLKAVGGDYLRIQGKNLYRKGWKAQVVLISVNEKKVIRTAVTRTFDDYSVQVDIPREIAAGSYMLYYHNGMGGRTAWSEPLEIVVVAKPENLWAKKTFNVFDFGAKGDGVNDETAAFRAALDAAESNGGGTVYVPRGRYMLTGELNLSPNTMLKGESSAQTQLFWSPLNWDTGEMPPTLISGTHHFGLKDLNIWATRAWGIIMQTGPVKQQGHVTLENLIIRQNALVGGFIYLSKANRDVVETEFNDRWHNTGIVLRGENIKMRNCDISCAGMYAFSAVSGFIQKCSFTRQSTGMNQPYMTLHPKGLIFEDCLRQADGFGYAATVDESTNLYEARNTTPFDYINDRESMTLDGGSGGYTGKAAAINGNVLVLSSLGKTNQWAVNKWVGGGLFILDGKGAGQYRRITRHTIDSIWLDQPFIVDPDTDSQLSITTIRSNLFYVNNQVNDAGAYQFYGSVQNSVIAGLKMRRSSGIVSRGSFIYYGKQPNWYIDIVNCTLAEGNYCHWMGIADRGHSGYQSINLIGNGGSGMNLGTLIRGNKLSDFSYIRTSPGADPNAVTDVIIEDNSFSIAKNAITLGGTGTFTSRVLIHGNQYRDVQTQVNSNAGLDSSAYQILDDAAAVK